MLALEAIEFVRALPAASSADEVGLRYMELVRPHGFIAAACGGARLTPTGLTYEFFFNTWPEDWIKTYRERDYVRYDVGPIQARLTALPFSWPEAMQSRELSAKQKEVIAWGTSIGIVDGLSVPIHYPGGDFGLTVTLADHRLDDMAERLALHMACIYMHQRCREIGGVMEASSVQAPLTPREVECMRLVAKGKSDGEIARELQIASGTVHFHIERVKKKLGVKTRTQAAAILVQLGYI